MDPTVRSIQIASALTERLGVLLTSQRTSVVSTALSADLASDELALRIGEAQQITPEIWSHLDSARDTLAERGVNVDAYDAVRAERDPAMLATSNIDVERKLDMLGLLKGEIRVITTKNVTWDAGNLVAAIAACAALKERLPDVDWDALDRADREQFAAAGSLRGTSKKAIVAFVLAILVVTGAGVGIYVATRESAERVTAPKPVTDYEYQVARYRAMLVKEPCNQQAGAKLVAYLFAAGDKAAARELEAKLRACK